MSYKQMYKYIVYDFDGQPLKQFATKEGAKDFIFNKPDCTIKEIDYYEKYKHMEAKF